ncbi:hypothetical protein K439DRAFT_1568048, partial [Ramaria rubella]
RTLYSIPRLHVTLLVQLRTGHVPLAKYLHRIHSFPPRSALSSIRRKKPSTTSSSA